MDWEKLYQAAVLEADWTKMDERIQAADLAITSRLFEFSQNHGGTVEENDRIAFALRALDTLRGDVARWRSKAV